MRGRGGRGTGRGRAAVAGGRRGRGSGRRQGGRAGGNIRITPEELYKWMVVDEGTYIFSHTKLATMVFMHI